VKNKMMIRLATLDNKETVVEILNKVTLDLHGKGIQQWEYPWDADRLADVIKKNYVYVLVKDENIIGTFCIKEIDELSELKIDSRSNYLYQIAILPDYQGNKLGSDITDFACTYAKEVNKTLYLDCWAGNGKLKGFYLNNGFTYEGDFPENDYFISIYKFN